MRDHRGRPPHSSRPDDDAAGHAVRRMPPDGNCLFHSLVHGAPTTHAQWRAHLADHILNHWDETFGHFVPLEEHADYRASLRRNGSWGDEVTLRAHVDCTGERVVVHDTRHGRRYAYGDDNAPTTRHLLYNGCHYDLLMP